jgi:anti-anti-sigma factor
MAASPGNPADCLKLVFQIQIDTTPRRSETLVTHGLQRFTLQFNRTAVQLHMSQIDYIDSAALGMLLIVREKANLAKKSISLSSPSAAVKQVLEIANFEKLFAIS